MDEWKARNFDVLLLYVTQDKFVILEMYGQSLVVALRLGQPQGIARTKHQIQNTRLEYTCRGLY